MCPKDADSMTNSVDPDQTAPEEQSDHSLHCFAPTYLSKQYLYSSVQFIYQVTPRGIIPTTTMVGMGEVLRAD